MPPQPLTLRQLNRATLARQGLLERLTMPLARATQRIGSFQAQHPKWPALAAWSRVAGHKHGDFGAALRERQLVRAWLMRTTLHAVAADDFWPMTTVTLPGRQRQFRQYYKEEATDPTVVRRLRPAHDAALAELADGPRTMAELRDAMDKVLPRAAGEHDQYYLWRHFIAIVPLVDVPGADDSPRYGRSWYQTAEAWLGKPPARDPVDDVALVVERYFGAYGPASVDDLVMWVGREISHLRPGIERLGDRLEHFSDETGRELLDLADSPRPRTDRRAPPRFLARWDGLLLAHAPAHRARFLADELRDAVYTKNADVRPTFLVDGFVAGTWEATQEGGRARLAMQSRSRLEGTDMDAILEEGGRLIRFLHPTAAAHDVFIASS